MKIVTFSGIDGAGKSTQIRALEAWLRRSGMHWELLTFWDNVVVLPKLREFMSQRAFKGDQGIGSPHKPLNRRDKNVTSWPVMAVRTCLYFADAVNARRIVRKLGRSGAEVVIFDRYIQDELANLPLTRWWARAYSRLLMWIARKPDVAYVIDADPAAARARKPEYPLEFVRKNRQAYLTLASLDKHFTVVEPGSIEAMEAQVRQAFCRGQHGTNAEVSGIPVLERAK